MTFQLFLLLTAVLQRYYSASAQGRFFNIQIQASWGDEQSSSSSSGSGEWGSRAAHPPKHTVLPRLPLPLLIVNI